VNDRSVLHLALAAAKLENARDSLRQLLGPEKYAERLEPVRRTLREAARKRGESVLRVGTRAAHAAADSDGGMFALVLLAATCDEVESEGVAS
jgi:hypothetical protein